MPRSAPATTKDKSQDAQSKRSAAVRWALLNPSRRQLSKWEREERQKRFVVLSATAVAVVSVAVLLFGYFQHAVLRAQDTAALVGSERITTGDLLQTARPTYEAILRQQEMLRAQGMGQQAEQLGFQLSLLPDQLLNAEIEQRLIQREAEARAISVSDDDVQAEIHERMQLEAELSRSENAETTESPSAPAPTLTDSELENTYQEFLSRTGLDDGFYRSEIRKSLLREKVQVAVVADLPSSMEQVRARHILVSTQEQANDVVSRLQGGADFAALAEAESLDTGSKADGGDLGWFPRGLMNEAFETAAFEAEPGSGPRVVESPNGWHVLEVLEKSPDRQLEESHRQMLESRHFQEWLQEARQGADVQVELSGEESEWVLQRLRSRIF